MKLDRFFRVVTTAMLALAIVFVLVLIFGGDSVVEPVKRGNASGMRVTYVSVSTVSDLVRDCCSNYDNLRPELVEAVIFYESGYDPTSTDPNDKTVSGLMQVSAKWHSDRAKKLGADLDTNYGNILVGCDYLSELIKSCGDERYALMCYNGGPAYGKRHWKKGDITKYAQDIYDRANQLEGVV